MQPLELRSRLDADLVDQRGPGVPIGLECVGLAARAVQRQHQLAAQPLAVRLVRDQRLELADQLTVSAGVQIAVDRLLDRRLPQRFQPADLRGRERLVRDVLQGPAPPQRQRLARRPAIDQALEAPRVDVLGRQPQLVPVRAGDDRRAVAARLQRAAQPRDVRPQRLRRGRWELLPPQALHQPVGGHGRRHVQGEHREQRARLRTAQWHRPPIDAGLHGSEQPYVHAIVPAATLSAPRPPRNRVADALHCVTGYAPTRSIRAPSSRSRSSIRS